jgi:hypothetical protein
VIDRLTRNGYSPKSHCMRAFLKACVIVGLVSLLSIMAAAVDIKPAFSFADSTLRIEGGSAQGSGSLLIRGDGLASDQMTVPLSEIQDSGVPNPPAVTVSFDVPIEQAHGTSNRVWYVKVNVSGLPPNTVQKRYARITFNGVISILEYTVTNQFAAPFTWSFKAPASWRLTADRSRRTR